MQTPYPKLADRRELNAATMLALPPLRLAPAAETPRTAKAEAYDAMSDETLNEVFTVVAVKVVEVLDEHDRHADAMANTLPVRIAQATDEAHKEAETTDEDRDRRLTVPHPRDGKDRKEDAHMEQDADEYCDAGGQA